MTVGRGEDDPGGGGVGDQRAERGVVDAPVRRVDERGGEDGEGRGDAVAGEVDGDARVERLGPPWRHRARPAEDDVLLEALGIDVGAELEDEPLAPADAECGEEMDDAWP